GGAEIDRLAFESAPEAKGLKLLSESLGKPSTFWSLTNEKRNWLESSISSPLTDDPMPMPPNAPAAERTLGDGELAELAHAHRPGPPMYARPSFSLDERVFCDLVAHAPGLNSGAADAEAVKEAEAAPGLASAPGHIDPGARKLIEQSRQGGWRTLRLGQ